MVLSLGPMPRVVLAAVGLHLVFLAVHLKKLDGDPSGLVCCANDRAGQSPFEHVTRGCGPGGHDGQYYYAVARCPWRRQSTSLMDRPSYRHGRILYPALCWAFAVGRPVLLFYVMPAVNLLAVAGLACLGAFVAARQGASPWWGLVLPLGANAGLSLLHDFADGLSCLALAALLAAWLLRGPGWLLMLAAFAALFTREQNVFVVGVVLLGALAAGRHRAALGVAAVCLLWGGWVGLLWHVYGEPPLAKGGSLLTQPLSGLRYIFTHLGNPGRRFSLRLALCQGLGLSHLLLLLAVAVRALFWEVAPALRIVLAGGVAQALLGDSSIYYDFASFLRVFALVPIALWLTGVGTGRRWLLWLLAPGALWSLIAALRFV